jgi:hypothetical protein
MIGYPKRPVSFAAVSSSPLLSAPASRQDLSTGFFALRLA